MALKDQTKSFLKEFFLQLFVDTQISTPSVTESARSVAQKITSRDRNSMGDVFRKASVHEGLRDGLIYFINRAFRKDMEDSDGFIAWSIEVATQALGNNL